MVCCVWSRNVMNEEAVTRFEPQQGRKRKNPHSHCDIVEAFTVVGCYAVNVGEFLWRFQDSFMVPSSRIKQSFFMDHLALEDRTNRLSGNIHNYQHTLHNIPEEGRPQLTNGNSTFCLYIVSYSLRIA